MLLDVPRNPAPLPKPYFLEGGHYIQPIVKEWQVMLCFAYSRVKYLHKLFGILLHGRFFYSLPFIYSIILSVLLMDIYCILWILIQYCLICGPNHSRFGHWDLFQLALSLWHSPVSIKKKIFFSSISLPTGIRRWSRLILYTGCPIPRISHSLRSPGSVILDNVFETKIWVISVLINIVHSRSLFIS